LLLVAALTFFSLLLKILSPFSFHRSSNHGGPLAAHR
jgi:hypothetical protein